MTEDQKDVDFQKLWMESVSKLGGTGTMPQFPTKPRNEAGLPDSATLIQLAEEKWSALEAQKGIRDKISWITGWMAGYLTPNRPDFVQYEREYVLNQVIRMTHMIESDETERWEDSGRPKNDGYINGSHSGYGHAMRDLRSMIEMVKLADNSAVRK